MRDGDTAVYERTNGQDPDLRLGDDPEIAYQMWQRGAVFIPVHSAQTYHLGRATIKDKANEVTRPSTTSTSLNGCRSALPAAG